MMKKRIVNSHGRGMNIGVIASIPIPVIPIAFATRGSNLRTSEYKAVVIPSDKAIV
ncbi:MAG: hypothetical protein JMDDDDMK_01642 [Acidobacteria bacterium]|nr:hypothetical protein [Acidobacteriota bacterium]